MRPRPQGPEPLSDTVVRLPSHLISSLLSFNREGRWGTTEDFATSFLHSSLFSKALWDLPNSRPVHSLMLSSHLFLCLPCLLSPFTVPCKMLLARPDERETQQVDKTYSCYGSRQTLISPSDSLVSDEFSAC